ncbi:MAG: hypothetical protein J1G02_01025 [Clostridiales bacterium]|nr:hypothetical protein [Clostridiales bacterium]
MNKRLFTASIVLALIMVCVVVLSACNEIKHTHTFSETWSYDENYHWREATCDDTSDIRNYEPHSFATNGNKCSICDYQQKSPPPSEKHEHSWSDKWSSDDLYHWREPICNDTTRVKDKSLHHYEDYICTECGRDRLDPANLPKTDFKDVSDKYATVAKPFYDVALTILQDLIDSGDIILDETRNPRIVDICYIGPGSNLQITIREDVFIKYGEKSDFLQQQTGICLQNFGDSDDEAELAFYNFLQAEHKSQSRSNYESLILPYAEKSAKLILSQYEIYKDSEQKEIKFLNYGKKIILAESSLSDTYDKIVASFNSVLTDKGYPLITNQELEISFGGGIAWPEAKYRWIQIYVRIGNLRYSWDVSFNENGEFSEEYINYFTGTNRAGYSPSDPDQLNPKNEEYNEFFDRLKIDEKDLSNALISTTGYHVNLYF